MKAAIVIALVAVLSGCAVNNVTYIQNAPVYVAAGHSTNYTDSASSATKE